MENILTRKYYVCLRYRCAHTAAKYRDGTRTNRLRGKWRGQGGERVKKEGIKIAQVVSPRYAREKGGFRWEEWIEDRVIRCKWKRGRASRTRVPPTSNENESLDSYRFAWRREGEGWLLAGILAKGVIDKPRHRFTKTSVCLFPFPPLVSILPERTRATPLTLDWSLFSVLSFFFFLIQNSPDSRQICCCYYCCC